MKKIPSLVINVNDECNFRCTYCPPYGENLCKGLDAYDENAVKIAIDFMAEAGSNLLRLTGGEPLLNFPRVYSFLKYSQGRFKRTVLNTNGFLLPKYIKELLEFKDFLTLKISLDSLDKTEVESICGVDSLNVVKHAIEGAVDLGFKVEINSVITNQTSDSIIAIIKYAAKLKTDLKLLTKSSFYGKIDNKNSNSALIEVLNYLDSNYSRQQDERLATGMGAAMITFSSENHNILIIDHATKGSLTPNKMFFVTCKDNCSLFPCDCGVLSLTISTDGIASPCRGRKDMGKNIFGKSKPDIISILSCGLHHFAACENINVAEVNNDN